METTEKRKITDDTIEGPVEPEASLEKKVDEPRKVTDDGIEKPVGPEDSVERETDVPRKSDDIIEALKATGHRTSYCSDYMTVGVRLDGIKGKRGVHIDVVYVLDWRNVSFTGSILALQALVLETVNTELRLVLEAVGYADMLVRKGKRTSRGTIEFEMLLAHDKHSGSMVYETRTVYVVTEDIRPTTDLSWLTDSSRVVGIAQFAMARQSDLRSVLPEMNRRVDADKWDHLERSNTALLLGLFVLVFGVLGAVTFSVVNSTNIGNYLLPLGAMLAGIPVGIVLLSMSVREIAKFLLITESEKEKVSAIGDGERVRKCTEENAETFARLKDMEVVISPFMSRMAGALSVCDINGALGEVSQVLDHIIRYSVKHEDIPHDDDALGKFLGIFSRYDTEYDESQMSLSYFALSNYLSIPLDEPTTIAHCSVILNALSRIGIVRPEVKGKIDDEMNMRGLGKALIKADEEVSAPLDEQEKVLQDMTENEEKRKLENPEIVEDTDVEEKSEAVVDGTVPEVTAEEPLTEDIEVTPDEGSDTDVEEQVEESDVACETYPEDDGSVETPDDGKEPAEVEEIPPAYDTRVVPEEDSDIPVEEQEEDMKEESVVAPEDQQEDTLENVGLPTDEEHVTGVEPEVAVGAGDGSLKVTSAEVVAEKAKEWEDTRSSRSGLAEAASSKLTMATKRKRGSKSSA